MAYEGFTKNHEKRNKRSYQKKVDEHRCVTCGKQDERTIRGLRYCQICRDRHKANASPRKPRTPEQIERDNQEKRKWYIRCAELQVCIQCGTKDKHTVNGHRLCALCQGKKNKRQREKWNSGEKSAYSKGRRDKWREEGKCTYCGGEKEEPEYKMCIDCRVRARMRRIKRNMKEIEPAWEL